MKKSISIKKEKLKFVVTTRELITAWGVNNTVLAILKAKGAPIRGTLFLSIEPGYTVTEYPQDLFQTTIYEFVKE